MREKTLPNPLIAEGSLSYICALKTDLFIEFILAIFPSHLQLFDSEIPLYACNQREHNPSVQSAIQ